MAEIKVYRSYEFLDKDPVIDRIKDMVEKERLFKKPQIVHELSGVSRSTLHNWFFGETRRPQYATIMAVAQSLGYQVNFRQVEKLDVDAARKAAAKWRDRQDAKRANDKAKLIAARKAARAAGGATGAAMHRS